MDLVLFKNNYDYNYYYHVIVNVLYVCFTGVVAAVVGDGTAGHNEYREGTTQRYDPALTRYS